jgi:hypothetical protein
MRFRAFHPDLWNISNATVSNNRQPSFKMVLPSPLERIDQLPIQNVPLNITYKINLYCDLWNIKSFLLIHKTQHSAANPISTRFLCLFEKLLSQGPRRCPTFTGFETQKQNKQPPLPHKSSHGTIKKQVLNSFLLCTKATLNTPLPLSFY